VEYREIVYLLPVEREEEIQELMAMVGHMDFFIEKLVGEAQVLKVFIAQASGVDDSILERCDDMGLERTSERKLQELDWLKAWMDTLEPFVLTEGIWVDPFPEGGFIPPKGDRVMRVVPGTAFGTGLHQTTRLAARLLDQLELEGSSVVDVGCGTGILALQARMRGASRLLCLDDDPAAVARVDKTFKDNDLGSVDSRTSDLLDVVSDVAPFDIVVANIITEVLELLLDHPRLPEICRPETRLIFSGISQPKKARMEEALGKAPLRVVDHVTEGDWNAFLCIWEGR
jgi:ribosomal protein L11 methyltransferase